MRKVVKHGDLVGKVICPSCKCEFIVDVWIDFVCIQTYPLEAKYATSCPECLCRIYMSEELKERLLDYCSSDKEICDLLPLDEESRSEFCTETSKESEDITW